MKLQKLIVGVNHTVEVAANEHYCNIIFDGELRMNMVRELAVELRDLLNEKIKDGEDEGRDSKGK